MLIKVQPISQVHLIMANFLPNVTFFEECQSSTKKGRTQNCFGLSFEQFLQMVKSRPGLVPPEVQIFDTEMSSWQTWPLPQDMCLGYFCIHVKKTAQDAYLMYTQHINFC